MSEAEAEVSRARTTAVWSRSPGTTRGWMPRPPSSREMMDSILVMQDWASFGMVSVVVGSSHSLYGTIFAEIVVAVLFVVMDVVDGMVDDEKRSCVVFRVVAGW